MADRQARRGLNTGSARWRALRAQVLRRDLYKCQHCGHLCGFPGEAHVDHINGDTFDNRLESLQTLCKSCHSKKTALEDGGFGNEKGKSLPQGCSVDGWPNWRKDESLE